MLALPENSDATMADTQGDHFEPADDEVADTDMADITIVEKCCVCHEALGTITVHCLGCNKSLHPECSVFELNGDGENVACCSEFCEEIINNQDE